MAKPIKETPILRGKDAERFRWHMAHPTPVSEERKARAYEMYQIMKANNPDCELFR